MQDHRAKTELIPRREIPRRVQARQFSYCRTTEYHRSRNGPQIRINETRKGKRGGYKGMNIWTLKVWIRDRGGDFHVIVPTGKPRTSSQDETGSGGAHDP